MLRLMSSDPSRAEAVRRVRGAAIAYHSARPGAADRAFALYHQLMAVQRPEELAQFEGRDLVEAARHLRPYIDDLPGLVQSYLNARLLKDLGPEDALASLPDAAWARYLAGEDGEPGTVIAPS